MRALLTHVEEPDRLRARRGKRGEGSPPPKAAPGGGKRCVCLLRVPKTRRLSTPWRVCLETRPSGTSCSLTVVWSNGLEMVREYTDRLAAETEILQLAYLLLSPARAMAFQRSLV